MFLLLLACAPDDPASRDEATETGGVAREALGTDDVAWAERRRDDLTIADVLPLRPYTLQGLVDRGVGQPSGAPFEVDDDLTVYVNGEVVFEDVDHVTTTIDPISFGAQRGDAVRIVATDWNYCDAVLPPLELSQGALFVQVVEVEFCASTCASSPCFDPTYQPSLPHVYADVSFVIGGP